MPESSINTSWSRTQRILKLIKSTILFVSIALMGGAASHADTLALIQDAASNDNAPAVPEPAKSSNWFMTAAVGGNLLLDAEFKSDSDAKIKFKTGVGSVLGVGYRFSKNWSVDFQTGLNWNSIDEISATGFEGTDPVTATGGSGNVYQVPIMANATWSIPLNDKTSIALSAGIGAQWTNFNINDVQFSSATLGKLATVEFSNNSMAFRYQAGIQLANQVAPNIHVGFGVRISGTTEVNIGPGTAYPVTGGSSPYTDSDQKLNRLFNISFGLGVRIDF